MTEEICLIGFVYWEVESLVSTFVGFHLEKGRRSLTPTHDFFSPFLGWEKD